MEKRRSYHNKQSPREFQVLLRLIFLGMRSINGRNSEAKSCTDCHIKHEDCAQT